MDTLRKPFLYGAVAVMVLIIAIEIGAGLILKGVPPAGSALGAVRDAMPASIRDALDDVDEDDVDDLASASDDVPGLGIPYMAVLDGVVLFTVLLVVSSLVLSNRVHGRVQGCATAVVSILLILLAVVMIFAALFFLLLMIALLLSVPFGTIAYLAIYGFFNRGGASAVLALLMTLKIAFAVLLILAQQRFLQNRGLVLLILCSLLANVVLSFLHGFVPGVLVSITDAIGAIILAACGCIWWILALIGAVPAVLRTINARV